MYTALAVLLCLIGHVVRDGTPALGNTQLARAVAGLICGLGALLLFPWPWAIVFWLAIWVGFYTDQQHGKGQNAGWGANSAQEDIGWLSVSGLTSVIPLALIAYFYGLSWMIVVGIVGAAGLYKPAIWFLMWEINNGYWPNLRFPAWFRPVMSPPTRPAAGLFGAYVGAMMGVISYVI